MVPYILVQITLACIRWLNLDALRHPDCKKERQSLFNLYASQPSQEHRFARTHAHSLMFDLLLRHDLLELLVVQLYCKLMWKNQTRRIKQSNSIANCNLQEGQRCARHRRDRDPWLLEVLFRIPSFVALSTFSIANAVQQAGLAHIGCAHNVDVTLSLLGELLSSVQQLVHVHACLCGNQVYGRTRQIFQSHKGRTFMTNPGS
mmetsp:Transcript_128635/g.222964  ORF Transcript_128635/g.222964 Transcript_128635/m.222964 type:complete len:203 (-) Transcript_128635:1332-1940(-)